MSTPTSCRVKRSDSNNSSSNINKGNAARSAVANNASNNAAPKFNIRSARNQLRLKQLMKRKAVVYSMQALHVEVLKPLVDLAYSSTFAEVRRDTAAAFATLSFNDTNLEVLAGAGALGALLALVDLNTRDVASIRDAAIALAQMVKRPYIRDRFMQAPTGLGRVFDLLQCSNISLKTTALQLLQRLCTTVPCQLQVIKVGGLAIILQELGCHDESIRTATAALILQFTGGPLAKEHIVDTEAIHTCIAMAQAGALKSTGSPSGGRDTGAERCMLEYLTAVCGVKGMKTEAVRMGMAKQLLLVLDVEYLPGPYVLMIIKALQELVMVPENHTALLDEGLLVRLAKICFGSLAKRGGGGSSSRPGTSTASRSTRKSVRMSSSGDEGPMSLTAGGGDATGSSFDATGGVGDGGGDKKKAGHHHHHHHDIQHEVKRVSLSIFKALAMLEDNHDAMLRSGILAYMLNETAVQDTLMQDRRLSRLISDVIDRIATYARRSYARNQTFIAQGAVDYVERFLESEDSHQKTNAICFLAAYVDTTVVEHLIYDVRTTQILVEECQRPEAALMPPLILLRKLVEEADWRPIVVSVGGVAPLVAMIKRSHRCYQEVYPIAMHILHSLSFFEGSHPAIVYQGAIGFLLNMAKQHHHHEGQQVQAEGEGGRGGGGEQATITTAAAATTTTSTASGTTATIAQFAKEMLYNLGRDTAATLIQKVAKMFIVKRRLTIIRAKVKDKLIMPDIKSVKEMTRFPLITLKK